MPRLKKQSPVKNGGRYRTKKLPVVLPEMQTGNANQRETTEYNNSQRSSRKDAEPIVKALRNPKLSALSFCLEVSLCLMLTISYRHVVSNQKSVVSFGDFPP